ncbi:MAG: MopE-related protein [bacterium]
MRGCIRQRLRRRGPDEGCDCADGDVQACGVDVGACEAGEQTCVGGRLRGLRRGGGAGGRGLQRPRRRLDGEVDGLVEGCYDGPDGTTGVGRCRAGTRTCEDGAFRACAGEVLPAAGDDCDGQDNDCDGRVDEDFAASATACGQGVCANMGQRLCRDGQVVDTCMPRAAGGEDRCDGLDNDCDGRLDEAHVAAATQCGVGGCAAQGQRACEGGVVRDTCQAGMPQDEVQDAIDGDCDGRVDEGFAYTTAELQGRFTQICGGCHGGSGGLTLRPNFEQNNVGVASLGSALQRIAPGDPEASYLFHKMRGTQRDVGGGGSRMPIGGPFWADWEIERLRLWIVAR